MFHHFELAHRYIISRLEFRIINWKSGDGAQIESLWEKILMFKCGALRNFLSKFSKNGRNAEKLLTAIKTCNCVLGEIFLVNLSTFSVRMKKLFPVMHFLTPSEVKKVNGKWVFFFTFLMLYIRDYRVITVITKVAMT